VVICGHAHDGLRIIGVDRKSDEEPDRGFDRAYGLYAFGCVGGRMTRSVAYGHGDSGFYVGGTPPQKHPQTTTLDHLTTYKDVLGFSGSNSKYMVIRDSEFYDNGAGWHVHPHPARKGRKPYEG